jgi:hypothetical protein
MDTRLGASRLTRFTTGFTVTLCNHNDTSLLGTIPNGINNNGVDTANLAVGNLEINTNPRNNAAFNTALHFSASRKSGRWAVHADVSSVVRETVISIWR